MSIGLKSGLEYFIKKVENLPDGTIFDMSTYNTCVIGKTFGWYTGTKFSGECLILKRRFGITPPTTLYKKFTSDSASYYTDRQWSVIRLFTSTIGVYVSKQDWLEMAKNQLNEL